MIISVEKGREFLLECKVTSREPVNRDLYPNRILERGVDKRLSETWIPTREQARAKESKVPREFHLLDNGCYSAGSSGG